MPLFVACASESNQSLRDVHLVLVSAWDDEATHFLIEFGGAAPAAPEDAEDRPFRKLPPFLGQVAKPRLG